MLQSTGTRMGWSMLLTISQLIAMVSAQVPSSTLRTAVSATSIPGASITSASARPSSSASATGPQTHVIQVGNGAFRFSPDSIKAKVGDTVSFEFYPPDHSVARAEYMKPCVPYENTGRNKVGFWSGVRLFNDLKDMSWYNITINDTAPIFFYCSAPGSCIDQQMVGVINENDTQTLGVQRAFARNSTLKLAPGEEIPSEATKSLGLSSPTGASNSNSNSNSNSSNGHSLSGGAIAGIVVGAVAFLAICATLFFFMGRLKSLKDIMKRNDATVARNTAPGDPSQIAGGYGPVMQHADYGNLPPYGQHNATDEYPSGWTSPTPTAAGFAQPHGHDNKHISTTPSELASPTPSQQAFTAELEAPSKPPNETQQT